MFLTMTSTFTVASDVESFNQTTFKHGLAKLFELPLDSITLAVLSASIRVHVEIATTNDSIAELVMNTLQAGPSEALSEAVGVDISQVTEPTLERRVLVAPSAPPTSLPYAMPGGEIWVIGSALWIFGMCLCAVACLKARRWIQERQAEEGDSDYSENSDQFHDEWRAPHARQLIDVTKWPKLSKAAKAHQRERHNHGASDEVDARNMSMHPPECGFSLPGPAARRLSFDAVAGVRALDELPPPDAPPPLVQPTIAMPPKADVANPVVSTVASPRESGHRLRKIQPLSPITPGCVPDWSDPVHSAPEVRGLPVGNPLEAARYKRGIGERLTPRSGRQTRVAPDLPKPEPTVGATDDHQPHSAPHRAPQGRCTTPQPAERGETSSPSLQHAFTSGPSWRYRAPGSRRDPGYDWALE